jgi:ferric-dicitrate binding protein FerR (iron transport regulator)
MSDADDEKLLRSNLRVPALSAEALARIRSATEAEWRAQTGGPPRRLWIPRAAAVLVAAVALGAAWQFWMRAGSGGAPLATLARAEGSGVMAVYAMWPDMAVELGAELNAGSDFEARGASMLALHDGGNVRIAPDSKFQVLSANAIRLDRGEMYVDIPPGAHAGSSFVAITNAGEFRHVGTQFAIAVVDGATRVRVREGSVQWSAADGESTLPAGTELRVDRDHHVTRGTVESSGAHWLWTEAMAPEIDIEDRPLTEFLDWVARETGRKLVIADEPTRRRVNSIFMHGNVRGLPPLQALEVVMASTSLRFDLPTGAIRVSFAGESRPPGT